MASWSADSSTISTVMGIPIISLVCCKDFIAGLPHRSASRAVERRLQRFGICLAGERCPRNNIDLGVLRLDRLISKVGQCLAIDVLRSTPIVWVVQYLHVGEFAALDNGFDLERAVDCVGYAARISPIPIW